LFGKNEKEKQGLILLSRKFALLTEAKIEYLLKKGALIRYNDNDT